MTILTTVSQIVHLWSRQFYKPIEEGQNIGTQLVLLTNSRGSLDLAIWQSIADPNLISWTLPCRTEVN